MKKLVAAVAVCLLSVAGTAYAEGDVEAGKAKAPGCAGCHGPDGNSTLPQSPKLAGQHAVYLVKAMKDYKSGARPDPMMKPMMMSLSDQDIEDLAAYFAAQEPK